MAHICTRRQKCAGCEHYRFDEESQRKACFAALDGKGPTKSTVQHIGKILLDGDEETLEKVYQAFQESVDSDDEPWRKKGRAMLEAYLSGNADDFCIAVCGWSVETVLKKVGVIPDNDHTFN